MRPVVALRAWAVAMALDRGACPILILNETHEGRETIEKTGNAEVVDHVEQAELRRVGEVGVVWKALAELNFEIS